MNPVKFDYEYTAFWLKTPGYLIADVQEQVKTELQDSISKVTSTSEEVGHLLKGHIHSEYNIPITENVKYFFESMSEEYDDFFWKNSAASRTSEIYKTPEMEYCLEHLWVNYAVKHDFNPMHNHSGTYSFVVWVKLPYDLNEELKKYNPNGNETSCFNIHYPSPLGGIDTRNFYLDRDWEWKVAFFPSQLSHSVNPFYTSDDVRISIAGNVFLRHK